MIKILPSRMKGSLQIQPSKSVSHRALICSALAKGESIIHNFMASGDSLATLHALRDMGLCSFMKTENECSITGGQNNETKQKISCGESGSTLRFLLPLAFDGKERYFTGDGRLMERPMQPYDELFRDVGYWRDADNIKIQGTLKPGKYEIAGDVSSQFISGLLFALPLLDGDSEVVLTTELESGPYIALTRQCQSIFGVESIEAENKYIVPGKQRYQPCEITIEGDYSHAAFFAVAAAMGGEVEMKGLHPDSLQGDKQIISILKIAGADVVWEQDVLKVRQGALRPMELDVSQIPDLVPVLMVLACATQGTTKITNAARLRMKESDRLYAMTTELEKMGANIVEYSDSVVIHGTGSLNGAELHTHNDHRIAMALAVAATIAKDAVILDEPDVVKKSAPRFFEEFKQVGGILQ